MNPVFYFLATAFAFATDVAETGDVSVVGGDDEIEGQIFGLGGMIRNLFMPHGAYGGYPYGGGSYGNNMMMNAGGYGMNQGHYNSGNNYSNRSGWDRGYNHTDMNHYNNGGFMGSHGNFLGSNAGHYGHFHRRLDADDTDPVVDDYDDEFFDEFGHEFVDEGEDEEIDGQGWHKKRYKKYGYPHYRSYYPQYTYPPNYPPPSYAMYTPGGYYGRGYPYYY